MTLPIPAPTKRVPSELAVKLLKEAKECFLTQVRDGVGLCHNLMIAAYDCPNPNLEVLHTVHKAVMEGLAPHNFYCTWVNTKFGAYQDPTEIRDARLRWLDQLIVDFGGTP